MNTVTQGQETLKSILENDASLTNLARALLEAGVNEFMAAQADTLCETMGTTRNGFRERSLETTVGTITLKIPKLRQGSYFPEELVQRWSRTDRAVICAASEMYALGPSTRKIGKALEKMGAAHLSKDRVSRMCAELDAEAQDLMSSELPAQRYPYLWVDATYVACRKGGHGATAAVVTAIAAGEDGHRRIVGLGCVDTESYSSWRTFLRSLRERGLDRVQCMTSDAHGGLVRALREVFPGAAWQRCVVHLERDVVGDMPTRIKRNLAGQIPHGVFAETDPAEVRARYQAAVDLISKLSSDAGKIMVEAEPDVLTYLDSPEAHRRRIRTNNVQERCNREIKRRARVVQSFPSEGSLVRLVGAICAETNEEWSTRRYINPETLQELWEKRDAPIPDPTEDRIGIARRRLMVLAGLDGEMLAA